MQFLSPGRPAHHPAYKTSPASRMIGLALQRRISITWVFPQESSEAGFARSKGNAKPAQRHCGPRDDPRGIQGFRAPADTVHLHRGDEYRCCRSLFGWARFGDGMARAVGGIDIVRSSPHSAEICGQEIADLRVPDWISLPGHGVEDQIGHALCASRASTDRRWLH